MTSLSSVGSGLRSTQPTHTHGRGGQPPSFSSLDSDGSGGLNATELKAFLDKGPGAAGSSASAPSTSGTTSIGSTSDAAFSALFNKLDTDSDGSISETELKAGKPTHGQGGQDSQNGLSGMGLGTQAFAGLLGAGDQGTRPPPPPSGPGGPGGGHGPSLSDLDSDDDGSISRSEFGLGSATSSSTVTDNGDGTSTSTYSVTTSTSDRDTQALFSAIDSDGSGSLSGTEVKSFEKQMRELMAQMHQSAAQQYQSIGLQTGGATSSTAGSLSVTA
jgi:Ca2+-binding EF-hand superfamily protein